MKECSGASEKRWTVSRFLIGARTQKKQTKAPAPAPASAPARGLGSNWRKRKSLDHTHAVRKSFSVAEQSRACARLRLSVDGVWLERLNVRLAPTRKNDVGLHLPMLQSCRGSLYRLPQIPAHLPRNVSVLVLEMRHVGRRFIM